MPFGAGRIEIIMVVTDVLDHRDAPSVALAHEVLVLVAATGARFDDEVM